MRGLTILAWFIGGLPVATFVATLAFTNGAPVRAPSAGSGISAAASVAPDWLGRPALATPAGIPTRVLVRAEEGRLLEAVDWRPPPPAEVRYDRARAGWDRLERLAKAGDRDALVFLALMRSGAIPGHGRLHQAAAP